jgi:hypothetical protein
MPETAAKPSKRATAAPKPKVKAKGAATPTNDPEAPKKKMGAPKGSGSKYTEEIAENICALVSNGTNLRKVCRMEGMPAWRTVYDWVVSRPDFAARLAHARDVGYDALAEEALDIADTPMTGAKKVYSSGAEGEGDSLTVTEDDMLGHRKLQIETRLKLLACWNPSKYGNRTTLAGDAKNPLVIDAATEAKELLDALLANVELTKQAKVSA